MARIKYNPETQEPDYPQCKSCIYRTMVWQSRLKSKASWVAIVTLIELMFNLLGGYEKLGIDSTTLHKIIETVVFLPFIAFSIFNNPTSKNTF